MSMSILKWVSSINLVFLSVGVVREIGRMCLCFTSS